MQPSKGLVLAQIMFCLMATEVLVLIEIVFFDTVKAGDTRGIGLVLYFWGAVITCLLQLIGIILVKKGWFRVGGVLQMIASAPHALKLEGLIGIMGGLDAYDYPQELSELSAKPPSN
jgi:hypothetical protein